MHRIEAIVALTVQEELLIKTVSSLPAVEAQRILNWANQLASLAKARPIERSDAWTTRGFVGRDRCLDLAL
jgi:hypothetical protein